MELHFEEIGAALREFGVGEIPSGPILNGLVAWAEKWGIVHDYERIVYPFYEDHGRYAVSLLHALNELGLALTMPVLVIPKPTIPGDAVLKPGQILKLADCEQIRVLRPGIGREEL